jgi:hypothetical protein
MSSKIENTPIQPNVLILYFLAMTWILKFADQIWVDSAL